MENKKVIFVTGITGNQGSAVAKHLLLNGYKVIGLTRDASSAKAKHWKKQGVHIVEGNLNDASTFQAEMNKAGAIFFVQSLQSNKSEVQQGKQFINTIISNRTSHLVYASVLGSDLNTGIPHFDSKYEIETHIKSSNINYTILRLASFYENHLNPQVAKRINKGKYVTPLNKTCLQQMIGVDDIGKVAAHVFSNPKKYSNKILSLATEEHQIGNVPHLFTEAIKKPVLYHKLPGIIVRLIMGNDLYKMFKYMNNNDFCIVNNIKHIRKEFNIEGDFKTWIHQNFTP